jgi:hypothetical protein
MMKIRIAKVLMMLPSRKLCAEAERGAGVE